MKYIKYLFNYIFSLTYDIYYFLFGDIKSRINNFNYYQKSKLYPDYLKRGNAMEGAIFLAKKYCIGNGLDVGAGWWPLEGARPIYNNKDENANHLKDDDNSLDFVFSSHCLEHLEDWQGAIKEWYRVIKNGGSLILYLPHPACQMWLPKVNKFHKWSPDPNILERFFKKELKMEIVNISYTPDAYLSFHVVVKKI